MAELHIHRLKMESELQGFIWAPVYVQGYSLDETPSPRIFGLTYEGAIGQPR
jgi:hypothetical protein